LVGANDDLEAKASRTGTCDSFAIAAEAVILGVGYQAGTYAVKIDVEGDGFDGAGLRFNQDGLEAFGKERAVAVVGFVEPSSEALLTSFMKAETSPIRANCGYARRRLRGRRCRVGL